MKEFDFDKKPTVRICGKEYECDPTDNGLIEGTARDFPRILALAARFQEFQENPPQDLAEAKALEERVLGVNRDLAGACRDFIVGCLGEEAYTEIFQQRRPNSTEHVKLCAYLYGHIMEGRAELLEQYLDLPGEGRHAADKASQENS